jgi:hypothetical protein
MVTVPHPLLDAMPDSGSLTSQLTVTPLIYQPSLPSVPDIIGCITGSVASDGGFTIRVTVSLIALSSALSFLVAFKCISTRWRSSACLYG